MEEGEPERLPPVKPKAAEPRAAHRAPAGQPRASQEGDADVYTLTRQKRSKPRGKMSNLEEPKSTILNTPRETEETS